MSCDELAALDETTGPSIWVESLLVWMCLVVRKVSRGVCGAKEPVLSCRSVLLDSVFWLPDIPWDHI